MTKASLRLANRFIASLSTLQELLSLSLSSFFCLFITWNLEAIDIFSKQKILKREYVHGQDIQILSYETKDKVEKRPMESHLLLSLLFYELRDEIK